jgi:hypothetical protein
MANSKALICLSILFTTMLQDGNQETDTGLDAKKENAQLEELDIEPD